MAVTSQETETLFARSHIAQRFCTPQDRPEDDLVIIVQGLGFPVLAGQFNNWGSIAPILNVSRELTKRKA